MKKREVKELGNYLRHVASEMGLRDWRFDLVVVDQVEQGALDRDGDGLTGEASCSPIIGQKRAKISFRSDFRENSPEEQREIVVHELVHCHLVDMREFVRTGVLNELAQSTYNALTFGFDLAWEHAVDAIARPWSLKFPLIKWPK